MNKFLNEANSSESKKLIDELGVQIKHIPKLDEIKCRLFNINICKLKTKLIFE